MNKIKFLSFIIAIPLGIFLFIYGEYDDSPGGQLLGVVTSLVGLVGIIRNWK